MRTSTYSLAVVVILVAAVHAFAEDYSGAEIVRIARGTITFKHEGKQRTVPVAVSMKLLDDQGEQQDIILGAARFLLPGNIVDIKTKSTRANTTNKADTKSKSKSKNDSKSNTKGTSAEEIVLIKFVSGKLGELPKTPDKVDLRPSPNWKGQVFGGDGYSRDPYWQKYIATAKVGDFVEYVKGSDRDPARIETVEVGKDFVIIHKVFYALGARQEQREKHRLPRAGEGGTSSAKQPAREKETLVIAGKKIVCDVEKKSKWRSTDVPFDGLVKDDAGYTLTDFGRGK